MKAAVYTSYGPPDVLHIEEVEKPTPGDGEILIRVRATQVTAADYRIRGSNFPPMFWLPARIGFGLTRPKKRILGTNLAGEVEAVGKDVTRFKEGDRVFGSSGTRLGAYAEYVCLPEAAALTTTPDNATHEEATAVPFGAFTALYFLRDLGNIRSEQSALIYGASGAVGTAAVQLARHFGAEVTGVCSTANLELVRSLGADTVIDYTREDFAGNGRRYDLIFETVGKSPVTRGKGALKPGGVYLANLIGPSALAQMLWTSVTGGKRVKSGVASEKREDLIFLKELFEAGELRPVIDRRYPLERIAEAHGYAETGHKKGNVVVTVEHDDRSHRYDPA